MNIFSKNIAFKIISIFLVSFSILLANGVLQDVQSKYDAGHYQEALDIIKQYVEDNPDMPQALALSGKVYFKLGYIKEAKTNIEKAINLDKSNQEYRTARNDLATFGSSVTEAIRAKKDGKYTEAKTKFIELLKQNENFAEGHFTLSQIFMQLNEAELAGKSLKKAIELRPAEEKYSKTYTQFVQKSLYDGNEHMKRRNYRRAQEQFNQALILDPSQYLAHFFLARTFYAEKNYPKALEAVNKCLEIKDDYIKAYVVKGNIFMKMNKMNEALATFDAVTKIDKKSVSAWDKIGFINYRTKKYTAAIPAYNEVIKLKPNYDKPYENLGVIYSEQKKWDLAIINLKKATELNQKNKKAYITWNRLAIAYNAQGKAKVAANKCLAKKSNYAPAYFELGSAERRLGNKDAARNAFRMAAKDPKWKKSAEFELQSVK